MGKLHNWLIAVALLISISSMIYSYSADGATSDTADSGREATMTGFRLQGYLSPAIAP